jgi:hypothetical protein
MQDFGIRERVLTSIPTLRQERSNERLEIVMTPNIDNAPHYPAPKKKEKRFSK